MMNQDVLISYIVPVYNTPESFLNKCLMSLVSIQRQDIEILVINDGSSLNDVNNVLKKYANDGRIKIYNNKNRGVSYSRNFGIENAIGKYIIFVDSDDIIIELTGEIYEMLETRVVDLITFNASVINPKDKVKKNRFFSDPNPIYGIGTVWAKIYRKDFLAKKSIKFDQTIKYAEDTLFNYVVMLNNPMIEEFPNEIMYFYRVSCNHTSTRYNPSAFKDFNNTFCEFLKYESIDNVAKSAFYMFFKYILRMSCYNKSCDIKSKKKFVLEQINNENYIYNILFKKLKSSDFSIYGKLQFFLFKRKHFRLMLFIDDIVKFIFKKY